MVRAFIVKLNIDDVSLLVDTAAEIEDMLASKGLDVVSVKPWRGQNEPQPVIPPLPPTL